MSGILGDNIKLSLFGESHGKAVGIVINGLPAGVELDIEYINKEMSRRAPGKNNLSTPRKEKDSFEILSGYLNNRTTGAPMTVIIWNTNVRSKDYESIKNIMRPGHADYTGYVKYLGHNDYRGGGHFSGRLTAPLVFVGAICKKLLSRKNIIIGSHIKSIGNVEDIELDYTKVNEEQLKGFYNSDFPVIDKDKKEKMKELILKAKDGKDSVGGIVETAIINLPPGIGSPFFDSIESRLSHMIFSIPAVKGIEFGKGFDISRIMGSQANDEFYFEGDKIKTYTNNNGGINGGISNGMPVIFKTAIKPTSSIGKQQRTIDISEIEDTTIEVNGRHDPCIVPRALPVIEAVSAVTILDLIIERDGIDWMI